MASNRPRFELRWRTKKQAADFKRAAKAERVTLNEYILRAAEWRYGMDQQRVLVDAKLSPQVSALYQQTAVDN